MRFLYPAELWHSEPGEVVVSFRDVAGCHTSGAHEPEALEEAQDALEEAIASRIKRGKAIPIPSALPSGEHLVALPPGTAAKAALVIAMQSSGLTCSDVAARIGTNENSILRLLDPKQETPPGKINKVLRALGSELVVEMRELPALAQTQK